MKLVLLQDVCCDGVKCTPLIAAARHGREGSVRILLLKFRPPVRLETEGTVKFDEYVIEGQLLVIVARFIKDLLF